MGTVIVARTNCANSGYNSICAGTLAADFRIDLGSLSLQGHLSVAATCVAGHRCAVHDLGFADDADALITNGTAPFSGSFQPEGSLSDFDGQNIQGLWTLEVTDDVPTLEDLYRLVGGGVPLSLDIRDPAVTPAVLEVARRHEGTRSLWLCHPDRSVLADIRETDRDVILVHSTRIERIYEGPERMAADLSGMAIHAVNLPEQDWSAGLVALFRRFGLRCLAWDAQHPRQIDRLLALGLDGIYGDHVDRLVDGLARRRATN